MSKDFTPGLWKAAFTRVMVGEKLLFEQNWWNSPEEFAQAKANANLIATAPDMYEFLQFECDYCVSKGCKYCKRGELLKKARGEE